MVGTLERVLVCSPKTAGWNQTECAAPWQELAFHHAPDFIRAQSQHETLCRELTSAGADVIEMTPSPKLSLDAVYAHDASLVTDFGLIVMRPGKPNREAEGPHHGQFSESVAPKFNQIEACEANEWYGEQTLDVEAVHAMAPSAKILYVGASDCNDSSLDKALNAVVDGQLAQIVSNSYGNAGEDIAPSEVKSI